MPLNFPTNPVVGQGYQSGSSEVYKYNGSYWESQAGSSIIQIGLATSASFTPSHRRNITVVGQGGSGGTLIVADGKVFAQKANASAYQFFAAALNSTSTNNGSLAGATNMYEIIVPGESGSAIDANTYGNQAYILYSNGNLYTWGYNLKGQLGLGNTSYTGLPTLSATGVSRVYWDISMSQGDPSHTHIFILKTDGTVHGTGYNGFGQLGVGDTTDRSSWTLIPGLGTYPKYVGVCGSYDGCTIAQKSDGTIVIAGYNGYGNLGLGDGTNRSSFTTASLWQSGSSRMLIQNHFVGCRLNDGTQYEYQTLQVYLTDGVEDILMGAGSNLYGNLGDGSTTQRNSPVKALLPVGKRIQKAAKSNNAAGSMHVIMTDGTLYGWGYNAYGIVGNGTSANSISTPTLIMSGALDMFAFSSNFTNFGVPSPIVRKADGFYCWGYNVNGTIGDGTTTQRNTPVKMRFPQGTTIKYVGDFHASNVERQIRIAVTNDNKYFCWGSNDYNGITVDTTNNILVPLQFNPRVLIR